MRQKFFIKHLKLSEGVIIVWHTDRGRTKRIVDLWHRFRIFRYVFPDEYANHKRPFRLIKSIRASVIRACTFDMNLRQAKASGSGPTNNVGKDGENTVSPLR